MEYQTICLSDRVRRLKNFISVFLFFYFYLVFTYSINGSLRNSRHRLRHDCRCIDGSLRSDLRTHRRHRLKRDARRLKLLGRLTRLPVNDEEHLSNVAAVHVLQHGTPRHRLIARLERIQIHAVQTIHQRTVLRRDARLWQTARLEYVRVEMEHGIRRLLPATDNGIRLGALLRKEREIVAKRTLLPVAEPQKVTARRITPHIPDAIVLRRTNLEALARHVVLNN